MISICTIEEAKAAISTDGMVFILWGKSSCDVCTQFKSQVVEVENANPLVTFYYIDYDSYKDDKIFEPDIMPSVFIFNDGRRIVNLSGYAPASDIQYALTSIQNETFDTL